MEETTTTSPEATIEVAPEAETQATETTTVIGDNGEAVAETSYLDGKYNSVSDLETGYKELQKSYSQKLGAFDGAPEDGYTMPEGELSPGDKANMDFLQAWGAENQMSNDGLNSLAQGYNEMQTAQKNARIDAAYKELGENADRRLSNVRDYLTANIGEEATKALAANMNDAASIQAIEALIGKNKGVQPTQVQATQTVSKDKLEQMRHAKDDNGNRKMEDPSYRKMVQEYAAKVVGGTSGYLGE